MIINDTTLRGGQQAPHPEATHQGAAVIFSRQQQLQIAGALGDFGIDRIEIFSPVGNPFALATAKMIVAQNKEHSPNSEICVHSRCVQLDMEAALETGADRINLYVGTSKQLRQANHASSIEQVIETALAAIQFIHEKNPTTKIRFSTEDGFRTPFPDLVQIITTIANHPHVDTIGIPDTTGLAHPDAVFKLIGAAKALPGMATKQIETHFHNDRGLATANAWMAWLAGAEVFDTSILGLEERNGITPLASLLAAFYTPTLAAELAEQYKLTDITKLDSMVAAMLGIQIPHTHPITAHSFPRYVAGVHGNGIRVNEDTYQAFPLKPFGLNEPIPVYASGVIGASMVIDRFAELSGVVLSEAARQALKAGARSCAADLRTLALETGSISIAEMDALIIKKLSPR